ncbi:MAG: hypothetical protein ACKOUS_08155, partial [Alphaproteobacteria bacterium]
MDLALEPRGPLDMLERRWRRAAARVPANPFLGWTWISSWLAATGVEPVLARGRRPDGAEALGLLCRARLPGGLVVMALN